MFCLGMALPVWAQQPAPPTAPQAHGAGPTAGMPQMTPEMHARMMQQVQEMLIMAQNTAVWTSQGLVVLQGNRLLVYDTNLNLRQTVMLPATTPVVVVPPAEPQPTVVQPIPLRSMVPPQLIPVEKGLIVVRGQQVLRFDQNFRLVNQTTLPALPPLSSADLAATCPICLQLPMMPATGMPMPGTPGASMPGAGGCSSCMQMTP